LTIPVKREYNHHTDIQIATDNIQITCARVTLKITYRLLYR